MILVLYWLKVSFEVACRRMLTGRCVFILFRDILRSGFASL